MNTKLSFNRSGNEDSGFTLAELVVVLGLLALMAVMVVPALAAGRNNNRDAQCMENQRRLAAGWIMYAGENSDALMNNPGWVAGTEDWALTGVSGYYNTNTTYLTDPSQSAMAAYVKGAQLFKCPADVFTPATWAKPRVRSVSLNGALSGLNGGAGPVVRGHGRFGNRSYYGSGGPAPTTGGPAKKMSDLNTPGPAGIYLIVDEHPDSINDASFLVDPGSPNTQEQWRDLPASYHDGGAGISYADGHAEIHHWQEPSRPSGTGAAHNATFYPVNYMTYISAPWKSGFMFNSRDYEWIDDGTPYRLF